MVTRRPIELTLIHTPESGEEYGEFPQLGLGKVADFGKVQRTLYDLNMAVPETDCVSEKPIELRIYSPNVPDLTMVDLPGYIQITNKNQPPILKQRIQELCNKYISENNIILAVSAADVDLANSEALRASRKVDPLGLRTLGVITKMDLVDANLGVSILRNTDYPLDLGYVGVVCKPRQSSRFDKEKTHAVSVDDGFFKQFPQYSVRDVRVGVPALRSQLMHVLEDTMGRSLHGVVDAVERELEEANYQFKVQYNDRKLTAESYVAESIDTLKQRFKAFSSAFGKPEVREEVRKMLQKRVIDACAQVYYSDPKGEEFPTLCMTEPYWQNKIDLCASALTKSGIGRASTQRVVDTLQAKVEEITSGEPFINHPETQRKVLAFTNDLIRARFHNTVDQVENAIKPYKSEVDLTEAEWIEGQKRAQEMLERELAEKENVLQGIKAQVGRRNLRIAISHVENIEKAQAMRREAGQPTEDDGPRLNPKLLEKAREAVQLRMQILTLRARVSAIRSRQCRSWDNRSCCPEVYLAAISEKLTQSAVMFLQVEMLNEFFFQWPREVDNRLYYDMNRQQINEFARENPQIRRHLDLQERKDKLELVMQKLQYLQRRAQDRARQP